MVKAMREKLPDRRKNWTVKARVGGHSVNLCFGYYADGRLGEIWIDEARVGSYVKGIVGALARMASISLQCGASVEEVASALIGLNFPPQGEVVSEGSSVPWADSIADWIGKEMLHRHGARTGPWKVAGKHEPGSGV